MTILSNNHIPSRIKFSLATFALLGVLFLASCTIQSGSGNLSINLGSKALGEDSYVRIQILNNGQPVVLEAPDKVVYEQKLDGSVQSYTSPGLVPGPGYQVVLVTGKKNTENGKFVVSYYGSSEVFAVSSGLNLAKEVLLKASPFESLTQTGNGVVAVVDGTLWYVDGATLSAESFAGTKTSVSTNVSALSGKNIQGLSVGKLFGPQVSGKNTFTNELWVNTDKGIVPYYTATGFDANFMPADLEPSVTNSIGVFFEGDSSDPGSLVYFYKGKGQVVGGTSESDNNKATKDWDWGDLASMKNNEDFASFRDLIDSITKDIVTTFAVSDDFVYLSTPIATVILNQSLQDAVQAYKDANPDTPLTADWITENVLDNDAANVRIYDNLHQEQVITAISTAGGLTFASTARGLYVADVSSEGVETAAGYIEFTAVPVTTYVGLASMLYNSDVYTAALSAKGDLYILKNRVLVSTFPSYSGLPGAKASLSFWKNSAGLWLIASGVDGVARSKVAP